MGAIKITGEGLVIVGKIMKAEGVDEFIKGFGEDLLTKYAPKSLKWFRPEARAVGALSSDVEKAISDKGLRSLVQQTLGRYPEIIGQIATGGNAIPTPQYDIYLRLVPRYLVNDEAVKEIAKPLDTAARLQQLKGGPEARQIFFRQLVNELDETYRNNGVSVSKPLQAGSGVAFRIICRSVSELFVVKSLHARAERNVGSSSKCCDGSVSGDPAISGTKEISGDGCGRRGRLLSNRSKMGKSVSEAWADSSCTQVKRRPRRAKGSLTEDQGRD
jgi:hypothetical protein